MKCFASQKESSSHLNHFLHYQNSKCFDAEVKKAVSQKNRKNDTFRKKDCFCKIIYAIIASNDVGTNYGLPKQKG